MSEHVGFQSGPHTEAILTVAAAAPSRREDLLSAIGLSNAYGNFRRHVLPLVDVRFPPNAGQSASWFRLSEVAVFRILAG